jgi:hypothetical protein
MMADLATPVQTPQSYNGRQDPSALTTEFVLRETKHLEEKLDIRLGGMDEALKIVQKYPTEVDRAISQLKELIFEKFASVDRRFAERDTRGNQARVDQQKMVDLALTAAKDLLAEANSSSERAILKQEAATKEQIVAVSDKVEDVKTRLTAMESQSQGAGKSVGWIFAGIAAFATLFGIVTTIVSIVVVVVSN